MALADALTAKWFWYSILCVLCWGGWTLCGKLGSADITAKTMQFLFPFGCLQVVLVFLIRSRCKLEKSAKGILYGILMGVLAGIGGLALFAAYRTGGSTSVITAATAAYPMITVILAMFLLHERLDWRQWAGLGFAAISFVIFSL